MGPTIKFPSEMPAETIVLRSWLDELHAMLPSCVKGFVTLGIRILLTLVVLPLHLFLDRTKGMVPNHIVNEARKQ